MKFGIVKRFLIIDTSNYLGSVELSPKLSSLFPEMKKLPLSASNDPVYSVIRSMNFEHIPKEIHSLAVKLSDQYNVLLDFFYCLIKNRNDITQRQ